MPGRQREEGLVEVVIGPVEQAPKPLEGFDLDKIASSDAELASLAFRYFGLDPDAPGARQQLRRILSKKVRRRNGGRRSGDLALALEMNESGVTDDDTAPAAADKIAAYRRKQRGSRETLIQSVRRHRRKVRDVVDGGLKLGG
jgi:hypothetical protein